MAISIKKIEQKLKTFFSANLSLESIYIEISFGRRPWYDNDVYIDEDSCNGVFSKSSIKNLQAFFKSLSNEEIENLALSSLFEEDQYADKDLIPEESDNMKGCISADKFIKVSKTAPKKKTFLDNYYRVFPFNVYSPIHWVIDDLATGKKSIGMKYDEVTLYCQKLLNTSTLNSKKTKAARSKILLDQAKVLKKSSISLENRLAEEIIKELKKK